MTEDILRAFERLEQVTTFDEYKFNSSVPMETLLAARIFFSEKFAFTNNMVTVNYKALKLAEEAYESESDSAKIKHLKLGESVQKANVYARSECKGFLSVVNQRKVLLKESESTARSISNMNGVLSQLISVSKQEFQTQQFLKDNNEQNKNY